MPCAALRAHLPFRGFFPDFLTGGTSVLENHIELCPFCRGTKIIPNNGVLFSAWSGAFAALVRVGGARNFVQERAETEGTSVFSVKNCIVLAGVA